MHELANPRIYTCAIYFQAEPFPEIKSTNSLVAKHLTPELWEKLSGEVTETSGFTLSKVFSIYSWHIDQTQIMI